MRRKNYSAKPKHPTKSVRYTFRLTREQDEQFHRLLEKTGCQDNKSRYILSRVLD